MKRCSHDQGEQSFWRSLLPYKIDRSTFYPLPQARSSLTFKGPANETRIRRPPNLPAPLAKVSAPEKQKSVRKVARSVDEVAEDANAGKFRLSEKQKGKRKAIEAEPIDSREDANRRGKFSIFPAFFSCIRLLTAEHTVDFKIVHYEASTSSSTVDKTWKPLSRSAKDELSKLAKQTESYVSCFPLLRYSSLTISREL